MHIVCYDTQYSSLSEAAGNADGVTVLGFLFEVSSFLICYVKQAFNALWPRV